MGPYHGGASPGSALGKRWAIYWREGRRSSIRTCRCFSRPTGGRFPFLCFWPWGPIPFTPIPVHREPRWGEGSLIDFRIFVQQVAQLEGGGVYLNLGSAVLLPEVFLKSVSLVRNSGQSLAKFTTANLDFIQHYRPTRNVVATSGGQGRYGHRAHRTPRDHDPSSGSDACSQLTSSFSSRVSTGDSRIGQHGVIPLFGLDREIGPRRLPGPRARPTPLRISTVRIRSCGFAPTSSWRLFDWLAGVRFRLGFPLSGLDPAERTVRVWTGTPGATHPRVSRPLWPGLGLLCRGSLVAPEISGQGAVGLDPVGGLAGPGRPASLPAYPGERCLSLCSGRAGAPLGRQSLSVFSSGSQRSGGFTAS